MPIIVALDHLQYFLLQMRAEWYIAADFFLMVHELFFPYFLFTVLLSIHYNTLCFSVGQICFLFAMSRCSPGYTGNPQTLGGSCQECECDQYGSMPVPCDPATGVCTCKPGFTGWKCAGCEHRYARDGMKCICTYTNTILENTRFPYFRNSILLLQQSVVWLPLKMLVMFLTALAFWSIFFASLEMLGKFSIILKMLTENCQQNLEGCFSFAFWSL